MARQIVLLRGINLAGRNRIAMPALREALSDAGFGEVRTYVQSGNVVVSSDASPKQVARKCEREIKSRFGLDIPVVVRTRDEVAEIVERNPLADVAVNPKRYQVNFLDSEPDADVLRKLEEAAVEPERYVVAGREVYTWHPESIARSKLWTLLAGRKLGVTATARNWTTVTKLLEMAED